MKVIFLAVAMDREAKPLYEKLINREEKEINGYKFYEGNIFDKKIVIGLSSIGLINTSSLITTAKMNYDIECIICYGMSGGYNRDMHTNDLIIGTSVLNIGAYITNQISNESDSGKEEYSYRYLTFKDGEDDELIIYNSSERLLRLCDDINPEGIYIHKGRLGSSDAWNKEYDKIVRLKTEYKIICEDMESAAVFQMANRYNLDVIAIRGVSNNEILNEKYSDEVLIILNNYIEELIKRI